MVDSRGSPVTIEIKQSSAIQMLDRVVIKAVWQWRFQTEKCAGMAVSGEVIASLRYELDFHLGCLVFYRLKQTETFLLPSR